MKWCDFQNKSSQNFRMSRNLPRDVRFRGNLPKIGRFSGRPRGTVGKASASEARGPGFEPPWLVQRSRSGSRPFSLVGNGAGAGTHPIDRKGSVFPRGTGRFLVKKGVHIASFRCLSEEIISFCLETARGLEPIRLIGRAQCFPGGLAVSSL